MCSHVFAFHLSKEGWQGARIFLHRREQTRGGRKDRSAACLVFGGRSIRLSKKLGAKRSRFSKTVRSSPRPWLCSLKTEPLRSAARRLYKSASRTFSCDGRGSGGRVGWPPSCMKS